MAESTTCAYEQCDRQDILAFGYCRAHYDQLHRGSGVLKPIRRYARNTGAPCTFEGCEFLQARDGLCSTHDAQRRRGIPLRPFTPRVRKGERGACQFEGCDRPKKSKDYCEAHYRQARLGRPLAPVKTERTHRTIDGAGYVRVYDPDHPHASTNGWVKEHIKVKVAEIGRPLLPGESVHHKNGVKTDNRPGNLELWVSSQPSGQRPEDLLAWAREIVARYEPIEDKL